MWVSGPSREWLSLDSIVYKQFPSNKVNNFYDSGTVSGTCSCSFMNSVIHLHDGLCRVDLGGEPVIELRRFGNTHIGIQLSLQSILIA